MGEQSVKAPAGQERESSVSGRKASLAPEALTSVCLGFLANITLGFIPSNILSVLAMLAAGGVGSGLFWRLVLRTRRRGTGGGPPRRIVLVLAGLAIVVVALAFGVLQLTMALVLGVIALVVVAAIGYFLLSAAVPSATGAASSVAISTAGVVLAFGAGAVANGVVNPGALEGEWRSDQWTMVLDDDTQPTFVLPYPVRWQLRVVGGCQGPWCPYQVQARADAFPDLEVVVRPGPEGDYRGQVLVPLKADCLERGNPSNVLAALGYDHTLSVRVTPGPYAGLPGRQRPTSLHIEVTDTATANEKGQAKGCPGFVEVARTAADQDPR